MLSATLGSQGASHARTPLNVVFIIDTYLPPTQLPETGEAQTERAVAFLKRSLVRTLLYFHCNMDARLQWTYQFFNSRLNQDIGLMPNKALRSLSTSTVATCMDEYRKIIAAESPPPSLSKKGSSSSSGSKSAVSPCYNLRRQLVHSLADFGLDIASYQSPMKTASSLRSQSLQKHFQPVSIRNYMYILSPLPRTWTETVTFLEGKLPSRNDRLTMEPRKSEILEVLKGVKDAFFEQGLWDRFLDQRTSLSWINTAAKTIPEEPIKPQTRVSATTLIQSTLELTMKAFGGHIIPQQVVCQTLPPRDVYSFATIFQTYRSLHINPGLGVAMSKDSWHALLSTPVDLHSEDIRPVNVMWSGNVLCLESSQVICSLDVAEPQSHSSSTNPPAATMDRINSLRVIKRVPSRRLFTLLHSIRIQTTMTCFPRHENDATCEHASYLLKSLRAKNDVLLLEVSFLPEGQDLEDQANVDGNSARQPYTRQALLHSTVEGSGIIEVLEGTIDISSLTLMTQTKSTKARSFSLAMMDKSLNKLGAFVEQFDTNAGSPYRLDDLPSSVLRFFKPPDVATTGHVADAKPSAAKPHPGETVGELETVITGPSMAESIDDLCLEIRQTYLKYLYREEHTVNDYVKRLNAASKEITALAAKQSVLLKEAQQKLVAFVIEFLRIWPSRMGSKYKQIAKEVNVSKFESRTQDHYAILDDERLELDTWKAETIQSVKDSDVRMHLRKLKTKDTQIQIVQNLHILLLINKYGLEENKPFKKDPGALKAITLFMDELCIAASLESYPEPGLRSPQTPRSKDMDSAKKFFIRIIARYYELSLPKVVEKLSIKCGMEKSLLSSPRPSRGSKQPGMKRSVSLGTLEKPSPLDFAAALEEEAEGLSTKLVGNRKPALTRQLTTDGSGPARSILNKAIFRNRQVVMTRGSVKGIGATSSSSTANASSVSSTTTTKKPAVAGPTKPHLEMEDEDAPPAIAKLRLKAFYHDRESEEVLRSLRRQQPLSKADAAFNTQTHSGIRQENKYVAEQVVDNNNEDEDDDEDDEDNELGTLEKYLRRKGTTSWGVIKSVNVSSSSRILKSPSNGAAQRRSSSGILKSSRGDASPSTRYSSMNSLLLPSDSVVPSTPKSKQGYIYHYQQQQHDVDQEDHNTIQKSPSTPTGRSLLRRHHTYNGIPRVVDDLTELLPRLARRRSRESLEDLLAEERPAIRRREV